MNLVIFSVGKKTTSQNAVWIDGARTSERFFIISNAESIPRSVVGLIISWHYGISPQFVIVSGGIMVDKLPDYEGFSGRKRWTGTCIGACLGGIAIAASGVLFSGK